MANIDDAAILRRAKEICVSDGFSWDWQRSSRPSLDQDGRRRYLSLAREQLVGEGAESQGIEGNAPVV